MAKNGRAIGNKNENAVARYLAAWVHPDNRAYYLAAPMGDLPVRRRPTSMVTPGDEWRGAGDFIVSSRFDLPFTVEAKKREDYSEVGRIMAGEGNREVDKGWLQARRQAHKDKRFPMMIIGRNGCPQYAMIPATRALVSRLYGEGLSFGVAIVGVTGAQERVVLCPLRSLTKVPLQSVADDLRPPPPKVAAPDRLPLKADKLSRRSRRTRTRE